MYMYIANHVGYMMHTYISIYIHYLIIIDSIAQFQTSNIFIFETHLKMDSIGTHLA